MYHLWFVVHQRFLLHLRFHFSFHHRHPWSHCVPKKKVRTANGEVQTREEATVFVKELDFFVNVMLLEETTAVLPFGKLCEVWKELIHTSHFLVFACTHNSGAHDIRSRWLTASRHPCFMCSVWFDLSSALHFALFTVPLIFFVILLIFIFIFHVGQVHASHTRIMGKLTTGPAVKNYISPKMAGTSIAIYRTSYHSLSPCINEFFYVIYTYLFNIFIAGFCDLRGQSRSRKKWKCDRILAVKPIA